MKRRGGPSYWALLTALCVVGGGFVLGAGCSTVGGDGDFGAESSRFDDSDFTPSDRNAVEERVVEESDLYRIDGDHLYVQNSATGLNVVDISEPELPRSVGQLEVTGTAGELYVRDDHVFILFEELESSCVVPSWMDVGTYAGRSELATVDGAPEDVRLSARYCLPGTIVASRLVGDVLYVASREYAPDRWASTGEGRSWLLSFDVSDPAHVELADTIVMDGLSREIHATNEVIYLAQQTENDELYYNEGTILRYIDITDPDGAMIERGSIVVSGIPQGRFHMDAWEETFRIVTFHPTRSTDLHVIDVSEPDSLTLLSSLTNIAQGEDLHATHFVRDRAYVVTYEPVFEMIDPLWIISLEDPREPRILSELEVPGWSDYIFPMGDRLVAVGRGDEGDRVAASLFDISNPFEPVELTRFEFGGAEASSEANIDYRGVTIVPQGTLGEDALLIVPYSDPYVSQYGCEDDGHFLQLFDLRYNSIVERGASEQEGELRRSVVVDDLLYAISTEWVSAVDVADRDRPRTVATVVVGDGSGVSDCNAFGDLSDAGCRVAATPPRPEPALAWLLAVAAIGVFVRVVRKRRKAS